MELLRKPGRTIVENILLENYMRYGDYSDMDLTDCDFSGLRLLRISFRGSQMDGCRFVRSALTMVNFRGASLVGADYTSAYLENTDFQDARLVCARFNSAVIRGGVFVSANLSFARFVRTVFVRSHTRGVDFKYAITPGVSINRVSVNRAKNQRRAIDNLALTSPAYLCSIRERAHLSRIAKHWYMPPDVEREISLYMI